jgi:hypothetical protein
MDLEAGGDKTAGGGWRKGAWGVALAKVRGGGALIGDGLGCFCKCL